MRAILVAACILAMAGAAAAEKPLDFTGIASEPVAQEKVGAYPGFSCGKVFVTVPISAGTVASYRRSEIEAVFRTTGGKAHLLLKTRAAKKVGATVLFRSDHWQRVVECLG